MKMNTEFLFDEIFSEEYDKKRPVIEQSLVDIDQISKLLRSREEKFKSTEVEHRRIEIERRRMTDFRKLCAAIVRDRKGQIKSAIDEAEEKANSICHNALPWYERMPKVNTGPGCTSKASMKRDDIVLEEIKRQKEKNPDKTLTAIYDEMGQQARNYRKRCSARTIRRIYETYGQNWEL